MLVLSLRFDLTQDQVSLFTSPRDDPFTQLFLLSKIHSLTFGSVSRACMPSAHCIMGSAKTETQNKKYSTRLLAMLSLTTTIIDKSLDSFYS